MITDDLQHILQLQKDLWRWPKSRSSVMIGAGFSLNSQALPGVTSRFPTWNQLVNKMFDELYPLQAGMTDAEKKNRKERFQSENYLRLASKYEAAFGYARLDKLIRDMNPDNDHLPGTLHKKLLELPWNDVFTTNYDTLLERTEVLERTYQTVSNAAELPGTLSPRIFKLHGSFSRTERLVIAEEHYRTYPKDSAPLVNSVQQSLLENSFVLLGFSGDDPNFLAWTGWIRDELQDRHSAIYLVGPLNLDNTDRLLLKKRGVTPIDLCPMFKKNEHYDALLWFLESLAKAEPQRPENWLDKLPTTKFQSTLALATATQDLPPALPDFDPGTKVLLPSDIRDLTNIWKHERLSYPGWIVAPEAKRDIVWRSTQKWLSAFQSTITTLDEIDKLVCVKELIWRFELSMMPLDQDLIFSFYDDLVKIYSEFESQKFKTKNHKSALFGDLSGVQINEMWLYIALEVMREAREVYDDSRWSEISEMVNNFLSETRIKSEKFIYEGFLKAAWDVQLDVDMKELSAWAPPSSMPIAQIWKAGLLIETGATNEAKSLLRSALKNIRRSARNKTNNIELLSLEGWCTYLISYVSLSYRREVEFNHRWQELKAWDCNPWELRRELERPLDETNLTDTTNEIVKRIGFDPKAVSRTRIYGGSIRSIRSAFAYLRHFEQVGMPMYCPGIRVSGNHLEKALQIVRPYLGFWSPAMMIRARQFEQITANPNLLSRPELAIMDVELAKRLNRWALAIFENQTEKYYQSRHQEILEDNLVVGLPEILSRLSFKLSPEELQHSFTVALRLYSNLSNISVRAMTSVCHVWLTRIYQAATDQQLENWLPQLLRAPFREAESDYSRDRSGWIDPMSTLPVHRISLKPRQLSSDLKSSIAWLNGKIHSLTGESKSSAIWRLLMLNSAALLDKDNKKIFKDLLWLDVAPDALPSDLHPFNYLHLPKRNERSFHELFKKHLISIPFVSSLTVDDGRATLRSNHEFPSERFNNITMSSKPPVQLINQPNGLITWTANEVTDLFDELSNWWSEIKEYSLKFEEIRRPGARNIGDFVARLVGTNADTLPVTFVQRVIDWVLSLRKYEIFADTALSALYFHSSSSQETIKTLILEDITSCDELKVLGAADAIQYLYAIAHTQSRPVDSDLLLQLVYRVAFRSEVGLTKVIERTMLLVAQFPSAFDENTILMICNSLIYWSEAVSLPVEDGSHGFHKLTRPDLQTGIATLAGALSAWLSHNPGTLKQHTAIKHWREQCANSCLPEVKRAFAEGLKHSKIK
ncbi:SIR2 family NAD-dependent protein deacylase [Pseudomonas massiliensis]|uniref:SIR2 family NAD-dependent protein deacylase n=1 Tax=Pseudomonas massiliensis TaxID=522492 RepID=UPI0009FC1CC5|nr:SIR2 family protein [Pseudomonas massiliensis]